MTAAISVFNYRDYKAFLNDYANAQPRGFRKALAESARCQTAYVTHVLSGNAHFSWDQAEGISRLIGFSADETQYFLLLLEFTRAGTRTLKELLTRQLEALREKHLNLKERVGIRETLSRESQAIYYSTWYYAAIHIAITIPELQTKEALARHFALPVGRVGEVLDFLESVGLAERAADGRYRTGSALIHLERESPLISKHHANWRMQALRALERGRADELHYSVVVSISEADATRIREMLVREVQSALEVVKASKEEKLFGYCLDFFEVAGS